MPKSFDDYKSLKGKLPSVLAVGGNERAWVEELVHDVRARALSGPMADLNLDRVLAKESSVDAILGTANTLPMMSDKRLVEVVDAEALNGDDIDALKKYIAAPNPQAILLLVFTTADARQKLWKMLDEQGVAYLLNHPKEHELPAIVAARGRNMGLQLRPDVAQLLVMFVGNDLLMLERALEKLQLARGSDVISVQDVEEQVVSTKMEDAFALGRAVSMGERDVALTSLLKLKAAREVPLRLVGMLAWQLRQVMRARFLLDDGSSEQDIGRHLALFGDRLRPVMQAAKRYKGQAHASRLAQLTKLDRSLKSSPVNGWLWLERAVLQLCPPKK